MSLLLYAITEPGPPREAGAGVCGRPVVTMEAAGLAALVSEHDRRPPLTDDAARTFDQVITSWMCVGAVLPARFGSMVPDQSAMRATLQDRAAELTQKLACVRGAVELGVRATAHTCAVPPSGDAAPGTAYLRARVTRERRLRALAVSLDREFAAQSRATRYRVQSAAATVVASFLVNEADAELFLDRVRVADRRMSEADLVGTGPWPPYSFAR
jgi:hypothetical protein